MRFVKLIVLVAISPLFLFGCAATRASSVYSSSSEYVDRTEITGSHFSPDKALLSDEAVAKILEGKVVLPESAHVAVLPLTARYGKTGRAILDDVNQDAVDSLLSSLEACERVEYVSLLPALLAPPNSTVSEIRAAAARFQAHLLLVYRVTIESVNRWSTFRAERTKTNAIVEAMLLDVRTGIVPFAATGTSMVEAVENKDDLTFSETLTKARRKAAGEALMQVARDTAIFLDRSTAPK